MSVKDITDAQVLRAMLKSKGPTQQWPYQILSEETGQPEKVCYRAMERAERRGLIEYGVSLRSGWLTDKGHNLLRSNAKLTGLAPGKDEQ